MVKKKWVIYPMLSILVLKNTGNVRIITYLLICFIPQYTHNSLRISIPTQLPGVNTVNCFLVFLNLWFMPLSIYSQITVLKSLGIFPLVYLGQLLLFLMFKLSCLQLVRAYSVCFLSLFNTTPIIWWFFSSWCEKLFQVIFTHFLVQTWNQPFKSPGSF